MFILCLINVILSKKVFRSGGFRKKYLMGEWPYRGSEVVYSREGSSKLLNIVDELTNYKFSV